MRKSLFWLLLVTGFVSCGDDIPADINLREEMRGFVIGISEFARAFDGSFVVIPQNGIELVSANGEAGGQVHSAYLKAIDGHGQEDLFYGYSKDDKATPADENTYLRSFLDMSLNEGKTILVTDYCFTPSHIDDSYIRNQAQGYVSFAADSRELDRIPAYPESIYRENDAEIGSLNEVNNFLYLINPGNFSTREELIKAVVSTNYDMVIMDLFFNDNTSFTSEEIGRLKSKANGGSRVVVAYMSIGEAEDYRYYWQGDWKKNPPSWMAGENPDWEGNYKVWYWEEEWQAIIYGSQESYVGKILDAGFDGVYLDIIDAYEYYE